MGSFMYDFDEKKSNNLFLASLLGNYRFHDQHEYFVLDSAGSIGPAYLGNKFSESFGFIFFKRSLKTN